MNTFKKLSIVVPCYNEEETITIFYNEMEKNKKVDLEKLYLIIIFLGGFSFHILWEAKSRYIIPYVIILFPLASNSLNMLTDKIFTKKEEYNRRSIKREK